MLRLITIHFSHYNEKARWALDRFKVPYHEQPNLPLLHAWPVLWATLGSGKNKSDKISSRFSTPILVTDTGECICDSAQIVKYVSSTYSAPEKSLYPDPKVAELEEYYSLYLGPHTRRIIYYYGLQDKEFILNFAQNNASTRQNKWFRRLFPLLKKVMVSKLRVTAQQTEKSIKYVHQEFNKISKEIKNKRFLVGDRFTAADMAFACMASPLVIPEGYGANLPLPQECPKKLYTLVEELRNTDAGQYVIRLFKEERGMRQIPCKF